MEVSVAKRQAYSEVYEIINLLDVEYIDKIPKKILKFFDENRDKNYRKNINPFQDISTQNLKKDTIVIFSMLNMKYLANEDEKDDLKRLYNENQAKIDETYSYENIFKGPKTEEIKVKEDPIPKKDQVQMVPVKEEGIFTKVWNFIKGLFGR